MADFKGVKQSNQWKDTCLSTKVGISSYQFPRYKEDDWWTMGDIRKEVRRRTGRSIHGSVAGRIAKQNNLVKAEKGIKVYHKSLVDLCVDYVNQYYLDFKDK